MKKATLLLALLLVGSTASAVPVTLHFTNADVDLGLGSVIPVTTEYSATWGITFSNAYRYIDGRDVFSDAPNDVAAPCPNANGDGRCNFGITNLVGEGTPGVLFFNTPTPFVTFDWEALAGVTSTWTTFSTLGVVLDTFTSDAFGTETVVGDIGRIEFSTSKAGFAFIPNITYDLPSAAVPEPTTLLLTGTGLLALTRRRRLG
jgi:hypothetical protein